MILAIISICVFFVFSLILFYSKSVNMKLNFGLLALIFIIGSISICVINPKMHKPFSIDIIEYLIKINDDGSITKTKQVTKTVITPVKNTGD